MTERIFVTGAQVMAAQMIVEHDKALGRETDAATRKIADQGKADDARPQVMPVREPESGETIAVPRPAVPHRGGRTSSLAIPLGRHLRLRLGIERSMASWERSAASPARKTRTSRPAVVSFWDALDAAEREELVSAGSWRTYAAGTRIMREGERADYVAVILGGRTKISVDKDGRERVLAIRGLGQLVGERASQKVNVRSATVTALEMVWALVVQTRDFAAFAGSHPRVMDVVQDQVYARLTEELAEHRRDARDHRRFRLRRASSTAATIRPGGDHAAGLPRHSPEPPNGENCTVLLSDVAGVGARRRTDGDRQLIRQALLDMTGAVLQGIPGVRTEDRGDGLLTVLPLSSTAEVMKRLLKELPAAIERHNGSQRSAAHIQLRIAVNMGPVFNDTAGISGEAIIIAARLLESPHFKEAIDSSAASLGVIVSPFVYETIIRPGRDLSEVASYTQVPVEVRESSTNAWMKVIAPDPVI